MVSVRCRRSDRGNLGLPAQADPGPGATFTAEQLASSLGVSARHVRAMREHGELLSRGRGLIDAGHALNATMGARWLGPGQAHVSTFTKAAVGWLLGHRASGVGLKDLDAWYALASCRGLTKAETTAELFNAARVLESFGCPAFRYRPDQIKDTDG